MSGSAFDAALDELRRAFVDGLPQRLDALEAAWQAAQAEGWGGDAGRLLHRLAHSLAGAAGTFGYPEIGDIARRLERLTKPPEAPDDDDAVPALLADLRHAIGT